jgi:hypothetical protein
MISDAVPLRKKTQAGAFGRSMTPDEAMERLERRVGPEGRKLFAAL